MQWGSILLGLGLMSMLAIAMVKRTSSLNDFAAQGGFVLLAMSTLPLLAGISLWREMIVARPLVVLQNALLLSFAYLPHGSTNAAKLATVALVAVFGACATAWYFYRKQNVQAYFRSRPRQSPNHGA